MWRRDLVLLLPVESGLTTLEAIESSTVENLLQQGYGTAGVFDPPNFETPTVPTGTYTLFALFIGPNGMKGNLHDRLVDGLHAITEVEITDGQDLHVDLPLQPYPGQ